MCLTLITSRINRSRTELACPCNAALTTRSALYSLQKQRIKKEKKKESTHATEHHPNIQKKKKTMRPRLCWSDPQALFVTLQHFARDAHVPQAPRLSSTISGGTTWDSLSCWTFHLPHVTGHGPGFFQRDMFVRGICKSCGSRSEWTQEWWQHDGPP